MGKSRKYKGGNPTAVDCAKSPQLCPTQTEHGGSLMAITAAGTKQQKTQAATMTAANASLASGGGKKKKGGTAKVICPQPAAGSGGTITAGGSSSGANMCNGLGTSQQQGADAVHDSAAKDLSTAPPCDPFSGKCGGGKRRRRRKTRRRRRKYKRKNPKEDEKQKNEGVVNQENTVINFINKITIYFNMKFSDMILALLIILVFVGMYVFSIVSVGLKNIKKDWPKYRCNPMAMPLAGQLGFDPMENFTFCITKMQSNAMGFFLEPIHFLVGMMGELRKRIVRSNQYGS